MVFNPLRKVEILMTLQLFLCLEYGNLSFYKLYLPTIQWNLRMHLKWAGQKINYLYFYSAKQNVSSEWKLKKNSSKKKKLQFTQGLNF